MFVCFSLQTIQPKFLNINSFEVSLLFTCLLLLLFTILLTVKQIATLGTFSEFHKVIVGRTSSFWREQKLHRKFFYGKPPPPAILKLSKKIRDYLPYLKTCIVNSYTFSETRHVNFN